MENLEQEVNEVQAVGKIEPDLISFEQLAKEILVTPENINEIYKDLVKAKELITAKGKKLGVI